MQNIASYYLWFDMAVICVMYLEAVIPFCEFLSFYKTLEEKDQKEMIRKDHGAVDNALVQQFGI